MEGVAEFMRAFFNAPFRIFTLFFILIAAAGEKLIHQSNKNRNSGNKASRIRSGKLDFARIDTVSPAWAVPGILNEFRFVPQAAAI